MARKQKPTPVELIVEEMRNNGIAHVIRDILWQMNRGADVPITENDVAEVTGLRDFLREEARRRYVKSQPIFSSK